MGRDIKIFVSVKTMNFNGEIKTFNKDEIKFFYRGSNIDKDLIILSVTLQGKLSNKSEIEKTIKLYKKEKDTQPSKLKLVVVLLKIQKIKSLGTNWLSNREKLSVGGAKISENRCFLNDGKASSSDESLIEKVKKEVFKNRHKPRLGN